MFFGGIPERFLHVRHLFLASPWWYKPTLLEFLASGGVTKTMFVAWLLNAELTLRLIYIKWYFYWWWNINPAALGLQQTVEFTGCNVKELKFFSLLGYWRYCQNSKLKTASVDPRDMLNNFCFHVYAQKPLFIAENCNAFFYLLSIPSREFRSHKAGSQLKICKRSHNYRQTVLKFKYRIRSNNSH